MSFAGLRPATYLPTLPLTWYGELCKVKKDQTQTTVERCGALVGWLWSFCFVCPPGRPSFCRFKTAKHMIVQIVFKIFKIFKMLIPHTREQAARQRTERRASRRTRSGRPIRLHGLHTQNLHTQHAVPRSHRVTTFTPTPYQCHTPSSFSYPHRAIQNLHTHTRPHTS